MPATPWEDVIGHACERCQENYATHIYGNSYLCCECHAGDDPFIPADIAALIHRHWAATKQAPPEALMDRWYRQHMERKD